MRQMTGRPSGSVQMSHAFRIGVGGNERPAVKKVSRVVFIVDAWQENTWIRKFVTESQFAQVSIQV
jgi:hypothetical protein